MLNLIIYLIYILSLFISAIMACIYYRPLRMNGMMILVYYLPLVFIQELTLYLLSDVWPTYTSTAVVYNLYRPITVIVFTIIYLKSNILDQFRKLIIWLVAIFLLFTLANYLFLESLGATSSYMALLRGFMMTMLGVFFLYSYFNLDNAAEEKKWRPLLWITIGIVTFYPVISISISFQKFLFASDATIYGLKLYQVIPRLMSIFMYGCFSYAILLCKKKN